jgi:chorismate synthase
LIKNQDQQPKDYQKLKNILRPGHASYSYLRKFCIFDYRGGGRASGRETATRVAAGAIAKQVLKSRNIEIYGYTRRISEIEIEKIDISEIEKNPVRSPDSKAAKKMIEAVENAQKEGDSLGGVVEILVKNCPAGLGEPVFDKLEADLAKALMSIGAVKAFEMGDGFQTASMLGSEYNDSFYYSKGQTKFRTRTNHAGGVLGGISNGEDLVMRITVKPPSSISKEQKTVDQSGKSVKLKIEGRHDPCICPRVVPVAEAMVALVLLDNLLMQDRIAENDDLYNIRTQIDTIDTEIIMLLTHRQQLIGKIADKKLELNHDIKDPEREEQVKEHWKAMAKELNISSELVEEVVQAVIKHSLIYQSKLT